MKNSTRVQIALAGALCLALLPAAQASADTVTGHRSCPSAAYSMFTGSYTAAGTVSHVHGTHHKNFANASLTWRYWTAGYQSTSWGIFYAGPITGYTTLCLT